VISWDEGQLPSGLIDYLRSKGIRVSHEFDPEIRAGISGAEAAVAETGTLVLTLEKGKPHFVSLIPEIHFAVLKASDIAHNLSKVFSSNALEKASMTALISGPSRTADIEMTLTIGVHGPGHVHVFCLDD
jgi:L-lactate dehydrogenase complex protein LldG